MTIMIAKHATAVVAVAFLLSFVLRFIFYINILAGTQRTAIAAAGIRAGAGAAHAY